LTAYVNGKKWHEDKTIAAVTYPYLITTNDGFSGAHWAGAEMVFDSAAMRICYKPVCSVSNFASCKAAQDAGYADDGTYTINGVSTACDMTTDGGGWTLVANLKDTRNNCQAGAVGTFTSKDQASSWRMSDAQINELQGSGAGHFRYTEDGFSGCTGAGACTGRVYWKYLAGANNKFISNTPGKAHGQEPGNIHFCSSALNGPYYGGPGESCFHNGHNSGKCGYASHNGLDTYGTGNVHNGHCGMYFIWCYGDRLYHDAISGTSTPGFLWVREA
jgi:hypothetical protein